MRLILQSRLFHLLKKKILSLGGKRLCFNYPPHLAFVSMPLAPVKLLHKMLKCKEAATWEVITGSLKL